MIKIWRLATQMPSKSHSILNGGIVRQLLKDGNEVTFIRSVEYKNPPPTLRQIDVSSNAVALPEDAINIKAIMDDEAIDDPVEVKRFMTDLGIKTLENEDVQKLLNDPNEYFDVVIVEFMDHDLLASFAAVFDCPLIWMSPIEINSDILRRIDAVPNPAHVPNCLSMNIVPFNFWQRVEGLWSLLKSEYFYFRYFNDMETEVYNRLIAPIIAKRGRQPPSFQEIRFNASLVLGYSHVSIGEAISLPQSYKNVGGYHIDEDIPPLPEDLKKIMDNAKDGVIYFSMGSNLRSKDWPEVIKRKLLEMLGGLKQTVLWKFEEQLPNIPKNVHISNWLPQLSVLAHPNCRLFITHGGLLSISETLHFGVPIIGVPAFGDQFINMKRAVTKGYGIKVDMTYDIVENLKVAIEEILSNPSYRLKAQEVSIIYRDRLVKPNEELSFWVRHVVETRGAPHLRSPALDLRWYQYLYLDLMAIIFVIVILLYKLLRWICSYICATKSISKKKNN
ncbi:unnamed protein product [Arctia plantaginis]|uniref:UDP-glucuronosyltransferase n=1 Tax=Arctia plantaginis TaxID=874455 RepID=A0A8S0ZHQ0_ARCPL|nr:unnamed protein product [Arctia plantaginis]